MLIKRNQKEANNNKNKTRFTFSLKKGNKGERSGENRKVKLFK